MKKKGLGVIILIIIIILLLFAAWFFLLKDKGDTNNTNNNNNTEEKAENKKEEPKDSKTVEYDYKDGVLTQIVDENGNPVVTDFIVDGLILVGNRHYYYDTDDTDTIINNFVNQGYKKEGLNSSFYLNEWIEFYIDTPYVGPLARLSVFVVPYKPIEEYQELSFKKLLETANEKGFNLTIDHIDKDNYNYMGEGYVNLDYPEGKYVILFLYEQKIAYFVQIDLTKEPTEDE